MIPFVLWIPPLSLFPTTSPVLKAALIRERARRLEVAAELAVARAKASEDMALIAAQKLRIAKIAAGGPAPPNG